MDLRIVDARILTDDGASPHSIEIEKNQIVAVSPGYRAGQGEHATIDAGGRFVLPGMINAHNHLSLQGRLAGQERGRYYDVYREDAAVQAVNCVRSGVQLLAHGVTTVRDAGSAWFASLAARDLFRSGSLAGPRVFSCGKVLSVPYEGGDVKPPGMTIDVADPEEIVRTIGELVKDYSVDFVKLKGHRRDFSDEERTAFFTPEAIAVAGHEAHRLGKGFAVHAWHNDIVDAALRAGVADSVEHGNCLVERPDLLRRMKDSGTIFVPNLTSWAPSKQANHEANKRAGIRLEKSWETVECAIAEGVEIAAGTDLYCSELPVELAAYLKLGMKRNEVLNTVTTTAARLLGLDESLGRVSPGYLADLLLIDRHPFDDLSALSSPDIVIMNGVAYDGHALRDITRRHGTFTETVLV